MKQRNCCCLFGVTGNMKDIPSYETKRMGQDGDHVAVLLNVFREGISHQTPATDVAHAGDIGKEVFIHDLTPIAVE